VTGGILADKLVAWAAAREPRPGLIGLVEDGRAQDCERPLAAGSTTSPSHRVP
jgi:hypothetical protein